MKTTIDIPDPLYREAKIHAVESGQTLRQLMLGALCHELSLPNQIREEKPYWANRKLLPEYEKLKQKGRFTLSDGDDEITSWVSEDRET